MATLLQKWVKPRLTQLETASIDSSPESELTLANKNTDNNLPTRQGIDSDRAAQRLGGDIEMFRNLLEMFFD